MHDQWREPLDRAIDARFDRLVELRRRLHQAPEPSGQEHETSLFLYQQLSDEGFDVRMGADGCGVIADPVEAPASPRGRIALRADIDALPIHDEKQVPYCSQNPGVMHACGHDAHTALVFGAVTALEDLRKRDQLPWPITLRAIFQPSEETCQGAQQMVKLGAVEDVQAILATHMDPARRLGAVGLRPGVLTANCDEMRISIRGRGGHAARPHETSDPIAAAAQLINSLYLFIPRATDSQDAVVVTIGCVQGGEHANVIPEEVVLHGTVRTLDDATRDETMDHIRRLAQGVGATSDTQIQVSFGASARSVRNHPALIKILETCGREVVGAEGLERIPRPSMGSEDFAFYLDHAPGAMLRIGCVSATKGGPPLHNPLFDIDEEAIRVGARILARAAILWSQPTEGAKSVSSEGPA